MKLLIGIFLLLAISGCAASEQVVYIPIKCNIEAPKKPIKAQNTFENIQNILIYTEALELALDFCINGNISQLKE